MNKTTAVKVFLSTILLSCFILGSSFFMPKRAAAEVLSSESAQSSQSEQAFHSVTFILDGEVYQLLEAVPNGECLGDQATWELSRPGYKFVGWGYGDGLILKGDTPITSSITVTAIFETYTYMVGGNGYDTLEEACRDPEDEEIILTRDVTFLHLKEGNVCVNLGGNTVGEVYVEKGELTLYNGTVMGSLMLGEGLLHIQGGNYFEDVSLYVTDDCHCIKGEELYVVEPHQSSLMAGYAPTCLEKGLTDGEVCLVCGEILTAQEEIDTVDHAYQEGECIYCGIVEEIASDEESSCIESEASSDEESSILGEVEVSDSVEASEVTSIESVEGEESPLSQSEEKEKKGCGWGVWLCIPLGVGLVVGVAVFLLRKKKKDKKV